MTGSLLFRPKPHFGPIYLYLTKTEYAGSWCDGGSVPVSVASKYRSIERVGTSTPDEVRQHRREGFPSDTLPYLYIPPNTPMRDNTWTNIQLGNRVYPNPKIDQYEEDAYILCMATAVSRSLMKRLGKMCCVRIISISSLKRSLDEQIGSIGYKGGMRYTSSTNRGHYLKSSADSWQQEYRFAWPTAFKDDLWVEIPPGTAQRVVL